MKEEKESLGSRSARTFSVLGIGRVVGLLLGVITVIIVARMLEPAGYGIYTLAFAFFMLIGATNNFGFGVYLAKHLAEYEEKNDKESFRKSLSSGYLSVAVIGILLSLLGIACSGVLASLLSSTGIQASTFALASTVIFFFMLYGTSDYALIGLGKNTVAVIVENLENVVLLVASVVLIGMGYGPNGAIAGHTDKLYIRGCGGHLASVQVLARVRGQGAGVADGRAPEGRVRLLVPGRGEQLPRQRGCELRHALPGSLRPRIRGRELRHREQGEQHVRAHIQHDGGDPASYAHAREQQERRKLGGRGFDNIYNKMFATP